MLVHCFAGVSRSASVVLAYLMREHGLSLRAAFKLAKAKRPFINPNEGFRVQLQKYEQELRGKGGEVVKVDLGKLIVKSMGIEVKPRSKSIIKNVSKIGKM